MDTAARTATATAHPRGDVARRDAVPTTTGGASCSPTTEQEQDTMSKRDRDDATEQEPTTTEDASTEPAPTEPTEQEQDAMTEPTTEDATEQDAPTTEPTEDASTEPAAEVAKPTTEERAAASRAAQQSYRDAFAAAMEAATEDATGTLPAQHADAIRVAFRAMPNNVRAEVATACQQDAMEAAMATDDWDMAALAAAKHVGAIVREVVAEVAAKPARVAAQPTDPRVSAAEVVALLRVAEVVVLSAFTTEDAAEVAAAAAIRAAVTEPAPDAMVARLARIVRAAAPRAATGGGGGSSAGVGKQGGKGDPAKHVAEVVAGTDPARVWSWREVAAVESAQYAAGAASMGALRNAVAAGRVPGVVAALTATGKQGCRAA